MAQSITTQSGLAFIQSNSPSTFGWNIMPTFLAQAPLAGCSRVIINKLTLRNTGTRPSTAPFNLQLIIGQDSTGYSPIGGVYASTYVGMFSLQQASGDSNLGQAQGNAGSGLPAGGTAFFLSNEDQSGSTIKNIKPIDVFTASPIDGRICSIPTQFWVTPEDTINLKLNVAIGVSYRVDFSFIFITEI